MIWYCPDCRAVVELNEHGYCAKCGSDALEERDKEEMEGVPVKVQNGLATRNQ